jgi:hypothetical protein
VSNPWAVVRLHTTNSGPRRALATLSFTPVLLSGRRGVVVGFVVIAKPWAESP